jgi:hypothetical protein
MRDGRRDMGRGIPMLHDQALRRTVVPTGTVFPSYENSLTVDLGSEVRATVKYLPNISLGH